jgi:hypothetical protein
MIWRTHYCTAMLPLVGNCLTTIIPYFGISNIFFALKN